jgi:hypothetical protein
VPGRCKRAIRRIEAAGFSVLEQWIGDRRSMWERGFDRLGEQRAEDTHRAARSSGRRWKMITVSNSFAAKRFRSVTIARSASLTAKDAKIAKKSKSISLFY